MSTTVSWSTVSQKALKPRCPVVATVVGEVADQRGEGGRVGAVADAGGAALDEHAQIGSDRQPAQSRVVVVDRARVVVAAASAVVGRVRGLVRLLFGIGEVLEQIELDRPTVHVDIGQEHRVTPVGHEGLGFGFRLRGGRRGRRGR